MGSGNQREHLDAGIAQRLDLACHDIARRQPYQNGHDTAVSSGINLLLACVKTPSVGPACGPAAREHSEHRCADCAFRAPRIGASPWSTPTKLLTALTLRAVMQPHQGGSALASVAAQERDV